MDALAPGVVKGAPQGVPVTAAQSAMCVAMIVGINCYFGIFFALPPAVLQVVFVQGVAGLGVDGAGEIDTHGKTIYKAAL